jgi:NSS family neurotransmitter:Na+ symporter
VGLIECLLLGWVYGAHKIRRTINEHSKYRLPRAFDWAVKLFIPALIAGVLGFSIYMQAKDPGGLYGSAYGENYTSEWPWLRLLPQIAFGLWIGAAVGGAAILTLLRGKQEMPVEEEPT